MNVTVLVVTMTGTAEMIAEDIIAAHPEHEMDLVLAERTGPALLQIPGNLLVVSSTYGTGEVPDPGKPLFDAIANERPDLSHLRYGVISLGDSIYADTFANGGRLWDALLEARGASRIGTTLLLDASGGQSMSDLGLEWVGQWLALASASSALAQPMPAR